MSGRANDLIGVIKSVADVTRGQIANGVEGPSDFDGKVVLFSTVWCGYCKRAIAHMQQKNIPYVERDIERSAPHKAEYARLGGKGPVPFIVFSSQTMLGFSPEASDQRYAEFQRRHAVVGAEAPSTATTPMPAAQVT